MTATRYTALTEDAKTHTVYDRETKTVVKTFRTAKAARRLADKLQSREMATSPDLTTISFLDDVISKLEG